MGNKAEPRGVFEAAPTAPDLTQKMWFRVMKIKAERRRYKDMPPITADSILDLRIDLETSRDVWDISGRPE